MLLNMSGSSFLNLLKSTENDCKLISADSPWGILPVKLLVETSSTDRAVKHPMVSGNWPSIEFE